MLALSLLFGAIVGFSLGLTGGGGSIFAVPLLVYGLSLGPREAVMLRFTLRAIAGLLVAFLVQGLIPAGFYQLVSERMPFCVGICVLLAIVYVLSRTGDRDAL